MVDAIGFVGRYFWVLCIGIGAHNYVVGGRRAAVGAPPNAAVAQHVEVLRRRFGFAYLLPWLVMGIGQTLGGIPTIWHYFRPQDLNPYVPAFFAAILLQSFMLAFWVLLCGGAKTVVAHHLFERIGLNAAIERSEDRVKVFAAVGPVFTMLWFLLIVFMDVHLPNGIR